MRGSEPGSAVPSRNEIHIKRELLEKYSLPDATVLETVRQIQSSDASQLQYPISLASSPEGDIYISDNNGHAIYHTAPSLKVLNKLPTQDGHLQYPNTIQVRQKDIFISDTDGIKIFARDGSFQKLVRIYYAVFDFAVDSRGNLIANPIFSAPKESDPLIVSLNNEGMRVRSFGKRMSRTEHDGLEDRLYVRVADELLVVACQTQTTCSNLQ
jgi:hypothetical protein